MAISKNGLRKIIVNEREFYWKFDQKIFVTSNEYNNCLLVVDFGWYDAWLYVNDKENRPPTFEPKNVTPKFVSDSILFGITEGWDKGKMEIEYRNGNYKKKG